MGPVTRQRQEAVIRVEGITKAFGGSKAVTGVTFKVARGEIFGFLGPNGAGKTTTLSILEGLLRADSGQVAVLGMDIRAEARAIRQRIGVQLQSTSLLPDLTVGEQVNLFARLYGRRLSRAEILALLRQVGLEQKMGALPDHLSGGQRQRLALALALVNEPEILFLDEPTTGLDPQSRRALWGIIRSMRDGGRTVILTTHYMEEAQTLCDRVAIIDRGRLVALDTPGALINRVAGLSSVSTSAIVPVAGVAALPEVRSWQADGSRLQLQTTDLAKTVRAILDLAEAQQIPLNDLQIRQPNLEDVFLHLTGRAIAA